MKNNLSLALNVVLLIAVGILFYLHFSSPKAATADAAGKPGKDSIPQLKLNLSKDITSKKILFINGDTINKYYEPVATKNKEIESKQKYYEADLAAKQQKFEKNYMAAQQLMQEGKITEQQMPAIQADLEKQKGEFDMAQQSYDAFKRKVMEEQDAFLTELKKYFADYSKENGIDYILVDGTGLIAFGNPDLDISKQMAAALNEAWKAKKTTVPSVAPPAGKK